VPVRRAEPALAREALGGAVRGRATIQFGGIGIYGEYTHQLVMQDLTNGSNWEGSQIFVGATYHIGEKFDL
jgi:predicted porin